MSAFLLLGIVSSYSCYFLIPSIFLLLVNRFVCSFTHTMVQSNETIISIKLGKLTLAGVAQWIECQPENQRVTSSIPSQCTCLGCGPGSQCRRVRNKHRLMFPSLSFSPPSPLSKNEQIKYIWKKIGKCVFFTIACLVLRYKY